FRRLAGRRTMPQTRLTLLLSGMIAGIPHQGGATWAVLQYLLGFRRLGHDVYFVDPLAESSLRPVGAGLADSVNTAYLWQVMSEFGFTDAAALLVERSRETAGLPYAELLRVARRTDLLINISGMLTDPEVLGHIPTRAYLDLDPGFVQLWHAAQGIDMRFA